MFFFLRALTEGLCRLKVHTLLFIEDVGTHPSNDGMFFRYKDTFYLYMFLFLSIPVRKNQKNKKNNSMNDLEQKSWRIIALQSVPVGYLTSCK